MKKIVLTTEQLNKVTEYVSNEDLNPSEINEAINDNRYEKKCEFDFNYGSDVKYKGHQIDDIGYGLEYTLSYIIDQEHRSWGIKSISIYDVQGPEELDVEVEFYNEDIDDSADEYIVIKVDWDQVKYENEYVRGDITIDDKVQIELGNDSEGNIIVNEILVTTYGI